MTLTKALQLKPGDVVHYPADRGDPAGYGRVEHVGHLIGKTMDAVEYIWITVRRPRGSASVWPSNRLG